MSPRGLRAGVYVDVENVARNGGRGMRFDTLRQYATRDGADAIRLNAYLAFDDPDTAAHGITEGILRFLSSTHPGPAVDAVRPLP